MMNNDKSNSTSLVARLMAMILAAAVLTMSLLSCGLQISAADLMEGINGDDVSAKPIDDAFRTAVADFSFDLYRESQKCASAKDNHLISPISALVALGMTSLGAEGDTRAQFEEIFGIPVEELAAYMTTYLATLESGKNFKLSLANSIWFDNGFDVKHAFLAANKGYYGAQMYGVDFASPTALDDINKWVKKNTDGMIDKLTDKLPPATAMVLLNAVCFDAKWQEKYEKSDITDGVFHNGNGETVTVSMLHSEEHRYIVTDDGARGMMKYYESNKYAFVALLPAEDADIDAYVASLGGADFLAMVENADYASVKVGLPKFTYDCNMLLNEPLIAMGLVDAFDGNAADFRGISDTAVAIDQVIHKTHIELDENGTKAAAVTGIVMTEGSAMIGPQITLTFDRPFVYAIIDTETNLPLFLGTIKTLGPDF